MLWSFLAGRVGAGTCLDVRHLMSASENASADTVRIVLKRPQKVPHPFQRQKILLTSLQS